VPAASSAGAPSPVRVGGKPRIMHSARVVGALASGTPLHLTVVLKPRDPAALEAFAQAVSTPGSGVYHDYLTPAQFADRFGATPAQVGAVRASLSAHGLRPGEVSANRLSIPVTATAAQAERAFSLKMQRMLLPSGRGATVASAAPALDAGIAPDVQAVLGLSSTNTFHPEYVRHALHGDSRHRALQHSTRHVSTGGPQPCSQASSTAAQEGAYTADQIASAYAFSSMYQAGDQGQGQTVAIYELEPNDPNDIQAYQSCYGTHASVSYVQVDGGAGSGAGSGEAALDIENAIGLAPKASFIVYQGANSNASGPGSGPYDTFNAIISQDRAKVVSVSWGECEADSSGGLSAENTLFQEAAVQGQSIVSASGDEGSADCNSPPPNIPRFGLAVDDPSSQPFVTGVGGTTLNGIGPPPSQTAWNNGSIATLSGTGGAGGGGISRVWSMPGYQSGAAAGLHVVGSLSSGSPCGAASGVCRQVPDVSIDADPNTGYIIYWNGSRSDLTSPAGWQAIAGTSASAPAWAALLAVINASGGCHSSPVGFANPALYRAAGSAYGAIFTDVTSGTNDGVGVNGGRYPAGPGYDMATGLGTPIGGGLASALCLVTLRIATPAAQTTTVGQTAAVQMRLTGAASSAVTWRAAGLPPGLSISSTSGLIIGRPSRTGVYSVVVAGAYQGTPLPQAVFTWTVIGLPILSRVSLTGAGSARPALSLAVASAVRAPALKAITISLPSGLSFTGRAGKLAVTSSTGARVTFSSKLVDGRLQITFGVAQTTLDIRIASGGVSTARGFAGRIRGHHPPALLLTVATTDAARRGATIKARIKTS
jgi:subtilase family serine protease